MIMMRVSVECEHSLDVKMANRTNLNLTLKPMEASNLYRRRMEEHLRPAEHYALGPFCIFLSEFSICRSSNSLVELWASFGFRLPRS